MGGGGGTSLLPLTVGGEVRETDLPPVVSRWQR